MIIRGDCTGMKLLEERIREDGVVKEGNVLKVDSFLNHQMDIELFNEMGKEWARLFADRPVTKILTVEASGIGIACVAAQHFHVPVVFAKKTQSLNIDGEVYSTKIQSFTHKGAHAKNQGFRMLIKSLRNALNRSCTVLSVRICGHTAGCIREML